MDKFKSAYDNYGNKVRDNILKTVTRRLKNIVGVADTIYRSGGILL